MRRVMLSCSATLTCAALRPDSAFYAMPLQLRGGCPVTEEVTYRLQDKGRWVFDANPERTIERTNEPTILNLDQAVEWVNKERPLLWLGSIFSVPEPSGFPSGFALTNSLLNTLLATVMPDEQMQQLVRALLPKWPLEALLDEFEFVGFDISESLLSFFNEVNDTASHNPLHDAVVSYYQKGLAQRPICITTNWDTLQEKAFRQSGYNAVIGNLENMPNKESDGAEEDRTIFVYHPHGAFETKDVVCSFKQEQGQLTLHPIFFSHPILFLGYSGYEPSIYRHLENTGQPQLWCIRDKSDLEIPAKRRLLCKPLTFVYVGDMRELLKALGVLESAIDLTSKYVQAPTIPPKVIDVVRSGIIASLDPNFCINALVDKLLSFDDGTESVIRYVVLMRALVNHIRDRVVHPGILPALMTSSRFHDSEQKWISALAYLLRISYDLEPRIAEKILDYSHQAAEETKKRGDTSFPYDRGVYMPGICLMRSALYKSYVRQGEKIDDLKMYHLLPLFSSDMAASGEFMEMLAFERLREEKIETARNLFDYAATSFYLRGLWNAGKVNEWAAKNIERMIDTAKKNTLVIVPSS